jgi:hypothetical protein
MLTRTVEPVIAVPLTIALTTSSRVSEPTIAYEFDTGSACTADPVENAAKPAPNAATVATTFLTLNKVYSFQGLGIQIEVPA